MTRNVAPLTCHYHDNNHCTALTVTKCPDKCAFYRTDEQASESREKADERLRGLSLKEQQGIADKYYWGKMVWL